MFYMILKIKSTRLSLHVRVANYQQTFPQQRHLRGHDHFDPGIEEQQVVPRGGCQ